MSKGDINMNFLVMLIIVLLSSALLFVVTYEITTGALARGKIEACRQSVLLSEKYKSSIGGVSFDQLKLKCPAQQYNIDCKDSEKAAINVANAVGECWYKMGENKHKLFEESYYQAASSKVFCIACSGITTDVDISGQDLDLIMTNEFYKTPDKRNLKYYDFINKSLFLQPYSVIQKDKQYLLVFVRARNNYLTDLARYYTYFWYEKDDQMMVLMSQDNFDQLEKCDNFQYDLDKTEEVCS